VILKKYQQRALDAVKAFLDALTTERAKPDPRHASLDAWAAVRANGNYRERANGLGRDLPTICVKVPTGGGKTLLATHILGQIHSTILRARNGTGIVIWVVPSEPIYRQTLRDLRDRRHPYRESLEFGVSGRVEIWEKHEIQRLTPAQAGSALNVLVVMLASTNRESREQLKFFRDSGGNIVQHFPPEDRLDKHAELIARIPNLERIDETLVKTSIANLVRLHEPAVILDEGHKATSRQARETIETMNPSIVVELSATPPEDANRLVAVTGQELYEEEMIKLPINVSNSKDADWKSVLAKALDRRKRLAVLAEKHRAATGKHIRPIVLVQVERTGKEQRGGGLVHAEDVRDHLVQRLGVSKGAVAVKSATTDDIESIDLLDEGCAVEWIITKSALQEGWDCPFAYVLVSLAAGESRRAMTQLVGRVLRQPRATHTAIDDLNESYVFCVKTSAGEVVKDVKAALENEGYEGSLEGVVDRSDPDEEDSTRKTANIRPEFRKHYLRPFEGKIFLPRFCVRTATGYEGLDYHRHLVARVDPATFKFGAVKSWRLDAIAEEARNARYRVSLGRDPELEGADDEVPTEPDEAVPGWLAVNLGLDHFSLKELMSVSRAAVGSVLEAHPSLEGRLGAVKHALLAALHSLILEQTDEQTERVFRGMHGKGEILFYLDCVHCRFEIPKSVEVRSTAILTHKDGTQVRKSLFDFVPAEINEYEKSVALVLDRYPEVLWWYRNMVGEKHFAIQGYRKAKVYPDFVVQTADGGKPSDRVLVIESKGTHLEGNRDTVYKQNLAKLFNECGKEVPWQEVSSGFADRQFRFQVLYEGDYSDDAWRSDLDALVRES
jgi:type III restriction enzyme